MMIRAHMIHDPVTVHVNQSLKEILHEMDIHKVSHLIVEDESGMLKGIISKSDLLSRMNKILLMSAGKTYSELQMKSIKAADVMTPDPVSLHPESTIEYAVELLLQKQFHCLPVVSEGKPVGIVSFYDLLKAYHDNIN